MTRAQFLARLIPFVGAPLAVLVATRRDGPSAAAVRAHMSTDIPSGELKKTREEWRQLLHSTAYAVLFEEGTERAFTSPLNEEKRRFQRVRVNLLGRYMLADRREFPCQVLDMSPGGMSK